MDLKKINWLFFAISFLVPVAGYVLYLIFLKKDENKSYSSGWGAMLGVVAYIIFAFIFVLFIK